MISVKMVLLVIVTFLSLLTLVLTMPTPMPEPQFPFTIHPKWKQHSVRNPLLSSELID